MIVVVAALMVRDGKILIARRPAGRHMGGKWEFPGGKLEKGESPEAALERELREELGVETQTGRIVRAVSFSYPEKDVLLLFYLSRLISGEPSPIDEAEVCWAEPGELPRFDLAPADRLMADCLNDPANGVLSDI